MVGPLYTPSQQYCSRTPRGRRRAVHETNGLANFSLSLVPDDGVHFCSAGTSFGNDSDISTCTVVQVVLDNNNLSGTLDFWVSVYDDPTLRTRGFNDLQSFSVQRNNLRGNFPAWMMTLPALTNVRFANNFFDLTPESQLAAAAFCNRPLVDCTDSGLPGFYAGSCMAFGDNVYAQRA